MELYQLEYFLETAKQRNFTRAAGRLNIAQTALSEQIRKLESELGTILFNRGRKESTLTPAGETLRLHAETLLEHAAAAKTAVREIAGLRGGRLSIGAIPSASACLLPEAIASFRKKHPLIELNLLEGTSESVASWVELGRVEFGIVQLPAPGGSFESQVILNEPFVVLAKNSHPSVYTQRLFLRDLSAESFVLYKGRARDTALAACRAAGFEPRVACESSELETIRSLVAAGLGIALLPQLATRNIPRSCKILQLHDNPVERKVATLTKKGTTPSPGAQIFLKILGEMRPTLPD
jgi:LysR family hydrogen peroxide-inducible transcriptional activator